MSGSTYAHYHRLSRAAGSGQVSVAEGEVEGYQPPPPGGKGPERFSVSGKAFAYSDYVITSGFHQTRDKGGPIHRNGQHVRVTFVGDAIVKLEVWLP